MLVLTRTLHEAILIGDNIRVSICEVDRGRVRLGVETPRHVRVWREEIAPEEVRTLWGPMPVGESD